MRNMGGCLPGHPEVSLVTPPALGDMRHSREKRDLYQDSKKGKGPPSALSRFERGRAEGDSFRPGRHQLV
jgi:hypothetical protein